MYFGNRERMTWVKAPAINADLSPNRWTNSGTYLNGGGYVRSSGTSHKVYQFAWNLAKSEDIRGVLDYYSGIYGDGLIYFLDPFAIRTNLLPVYWSAPRLGKDDAPTLVRDQRPTLVATAFNTNDYPTMSAVYTLSAASTPAELYIPVPPGYVFHLGVHGTATGTARVEVIPTNINGTVRTAVDAPLMSVTTQQRTNTAVDNVSGVTIRVTGTGILNLAGMMAQVLEAGQEVLPGGFISGQGHSGVRFDGVPVLTGYSAPEALDLQGASATLKEVGSWE